MIAQNNFITIIYFRGVLTSCSHRHFINHRTGNKARTFGILAILIFRWKLKISLQEQTRHHREKSQKVWCTDVSVTHLLYRKSILLDGPWNIVYKVKLITLRILLSCSAIRHNFLNVNSATLQVWRWFGSYLPKYSHWFASPTHANVCIWRYEVHYL